MLTAMTDRQTSTMLNRWTVPFVSRSYDPRYMLLHPGEPLVDPGASAPARSPDTGLLTRITLWDDVRYTPDKES
jgi:hypothetical protein